MSLDAIESPSNFQRTIQNLQNGAIRRSTQFENEIETHEDNDLLRVLYPFYPLCPRPDWASLPNRKWLGEDRDFFTIELTSIAKNLCKMNVPFWCCRPGLTLWLLLCSTRASCNVRKLDLVRARLCLGRFRETVLFKFLEAFSWHVANDSYSLRKKLPWRPKEYTSVSAHTNSATKRS